NNPYQSIQITDTAPTDSSTGTPWVFNCVDARFTYRFVSNVRIDLQPGEYSCSPQEITVNLNPPLHPDADLYITVWAEVHPDFAGAPGKSTFTNSATVERLETSGSTTSYVLTKSITQTIGGTA